MKEELEEYKKGALSKNLENAAQELADILYTVYGTVLEHGLQDKMEAAFKEIHRSNMSKDFHRYKMKKGENYSPPDLKKVLND